MSIANSASRTIVDVEGSPLEIHLHELRILSRSDHVDFRRVLSLYCTIEKCMRGEDSFPFPYDPDWIDRSVDEGLDSAYSADDAAKFCTAIESGKLIYIPGGKGDGTWLSSSQCTWKGENLRYSTAIHKYYGGNQHTTSLFRHILSVPDVGDHHLLKELDGLRVNDSGAHFQNVFLALNKFLVEAPVDAETRAIETFQNKSIFPVSTGDRPSSIEKYLKNYPKEDAEPEWYIAMTLRHEQCFKGVVPLLDFDFAFNARLNKLLNRFKSFHGHNLDLDSKGLTPILDPRGYQRLDTKYTDFLRKKAPFITRLVGTNFYDSRANVTSLSSLKVYSAPSLFVSYELGYGSNAIKSNSVPCSAGYSRKITRRNHGELKIYLLQDHLRDSHYKFQFELADVLEELCGTKAHFAGLMYLVLTERNERHVEEQFRRRGVPEITSAMEPEFFSPEDEQHVQKNLSSSAESRHKRKRPRRKAKARAAEQ
ncbi:hypothetical protein K458DRAFT_127422 [Lentithecium fluviatile CBS 122367]|uniref:Uncharacterized protein n=1 Tax=Lentithecium fluviatile CBS 122367 TaxID=1168545 RepID=A0A6G1JGR0_9PLEO|nr:hypothetical protein K458DRAFT_127422 [Lentithecium fluviatile CBS 122367]